MIQYLKRNQIDDQKYNDCIENALNSRIYAYSWYLDIVADNWDALVLNDYEAVMPLPWRRKYFIKYVYSPLWILQLGIFFNKDQVNFEELFEVLMNRVKYLNLRLNSKNMFEHKNLSFSKNQAQYLNLNKGYSSISSNFNRNRKRELTKAKNSNLTEKWNENPLLLVNLFKNNVGKRLDKITDRDYSNLLNLLNKLIFLKKGEIITIYNSNEQLISSAFFVKHKNQVTELVCSSDFKNRNNGANTFMNDRAIYKFSKQFDIFNFGGSSIKSIAEYYKSFGASDETYTSMEFNNLPGIIKILKK